MRVFKRGVSVLMTLALIICSIALPSLRVYAAETAVASKSWAVTYYYLYNRWTSDNGVGGQHRHFDGSPRTYASGTLTIYKSVNSAGNVVLRADFGHATGTFTVTKDDVPGDEGMGWWDGTLTESFNVVLTPSGWNTTNGSISGSASGLSITATTTGTYTFSYVYSTYEGADTYWGSRWKEATDSISVTLSANDFSPVINGVSESTTSVTSRNLTVAAAGGLTPYTYSMNGGAYQSSSVFAITKNGTYSFTVKDGNGKVSSAFSKTVSDIKPNIISVTPTRNSSANNVSVVVSATDNGSSPYTFSVNGGTYQSSSTFTLSSTGTYSFTVKDKLGNVSSASSLTLSASDFNPFISGVAETNASITARNLTVSASGGSGGYTYSMNGGDYQSLNVFNVSKNGSYSFTVKDSDGRVSSVFNKTIEDIKPNITAMSPTWDGDTNTVSITVSATDNGSTPYTYSMNGGAYQSSNVFTVSQNGTYTFTVKDKLGNVSSTGSLNVSNILPVITGVTETHNTDSATLTLAANDNGSTPYTYSMNGGGYQSSVAFVITKNGEYTFLAKDGLGNVSDPVSITVSDIIPIITDITELPDSLTNADSAILRVTAVCGTPPYYYTMNGSDFQTSNEFTVDENGTYTITVYDSESLISTPVTFTVDNFDRTFPVITDISMSMDNFWDTDGVTYTVTATDDHDIKYSSDGSSYQNSNVLTITSNGNYVFHVKDEAGNDTVSHTYPVYFDKSGVIKYFLRFTEVLDSDGHISKITLTVVTPDDGKKLMYSYDGSDFSSDFMKTFTTNGSHTVEIMDNSGHSVSATFYLDSIYNEAELLNSVKEKINAIGTVTYTDECKARIDEARAAYDVLNNSQKTRITNYSTLTDAEAEYARLKAQAEKAEADKRAADDVIAKINNIGTVELSEESKNKIEEARNAYDALTDEQKALVNNYSTLTKAEDTYSRLLAEKADKEKAEADKSAAKAVIDKINAIGTVEYTDACKQRIDDARKAYDALTDDQKALVTNYKTLTDAEAKYKSLKPSSDNGSGSGNNSGNGSNNGGGSNNNSNNTATINQNRANEVIAKINDIGTVTYTEACKNRIDAARRAYNALNADQKKLVSNYATLVYDEELYESLKPASTNQGTGNNSVSTNGGGNGVGGTGSYQTTDSINSSESSDSDDTAVYAYNYNNYENYTEAPIIEEISRRYTDSSRVILCANVVATDYKGHTSGLWYSIDGEEWQRDSSFNLSKNGEYTVYVRDRYGNMTTADLDVNEINGCPVIDKITQESDGYGISRITVSASGGQALEYSLDGKNWKIDNVLTVEANGQYTISVRNELGKITTKQITVDSVEEEPIEEPEEASIAEKLGEAVRDNWMILAIVALAVVSIIGGAIAFKNKKKHSLKEA